ncbi:hypothetical protein [[Mycoplasma] phocidae]|nr:hypothetical protein [[Mycoplasma] phocae]
MYSGDLNSAKGLEISKVKLIEEIPGYSSFPKKAKKGFDFSGESFFIVEVEIKKENKKVFDVYVKFRNSSTGVKFDYVNKKSFDDLKEEQTPPTPNILTENEVIAQTSLKYTGELKANAFEKNKVSMVKLPKDWKFVVLDNAKNVNNKWVVDVKLSSKDDKTSYTVVATFDLGNDVIAKISKKAAQDPELTEENAIAQTSLKYTGELKANAFEKNKVSMVKLPKDWKFVVLDNAKNVNNKWVVDVKLSSKDDKTSYTVVATFDLGNDVIAKISKKAAQDPELTEENAIAQTSLKYTGELKANAFEKNKVSMVKLPKDWKFVVLDNAKNVNNKWVVDVKLSSKDDKTSYTVVATFDLGNDVIAKISKKAAQDPELTEENAIAQTSLKYTGELKANAFEKNKVSMVKLPKDWKFVVLDNAKNVNNKWVVDVKLSSKDDKTSYTVVATFDLGNDVIAKISKKAAQDPELTEENAIAQTSLKYTGELKANAFEKNKVSMVKLPKDWKFVVLDNAKNVNNKWVVDVKLSSKNDKTSYTVVATFDLGNDVIAKISKK